MATPSPFTYPNRKCGGREQWCHTRDQVLHLSLYTDQWCNHLHEILKTNIADNQKLNKPCNLIDPLPTFILQFWFKKTTYNRRIIHSSPIRCLLKILAKTRVNLLWMMWQVCPFAPALQGTLRSQAGRTIGRKSGKKTQRFISFLQVTFYIIPAVIFWMFISLCLKNLNLLAFINQLNISSVIQWQNFSTCVITWYYITKRIYF